MKTIIKHKDADGNEYTEEFVSNEDCGGVCVIIKDAQGRQLDMSGSGGTRPWHNRRIYENTN